ncbi:hypothetical protein PBY51_002344 [Eleginops maclovinus]|uniref:Uncharacterized protein n=1 Tax=Eleginops maclovinus TaxID=56733 RepID=A0AAN7XCF7_ELEMC|nr:hypothetical protein PBY51_002344 [Eleginops maclovinus]
MENIDDYIWQRRIHHGVRLQKSAVPFPESVKVGLDFNAALERKEKLDLGLLTNSVMLEICDFAKTVTHSEMYFLFELMDFNFILGVDLDNDWQCYEYARRAHNRIKLVKDLFTKKSHRWKEEFLLPEISSILETTATEQPGCYFPKRNRMVDISVLTDRSRDSTELQKTKISDGTSMMNTLGGLGVKGVYCPNCIELGVSLFVRPEDGPQEKLVPILLTNRMMLELLNFSQVLCGNHTRIVHDLIKQNFGPELDRRLFRLHLPWLLERKNACQTTEDKEAFRKETFVIQTKPLKPKRRKRKATDYHTLEEFVLGKRRETLRLGDSNAEICQDLSGDLCRVFCDTEMPLESEAASEKMVSDGCSSEAGLSLDVKQEEEEAFVSQVKPLTSTPIWPDLYIEGKNEDIKVKTHKQKLWLRRTDRSKQILKSSRVNDMFARSREIGLDFNVCSGHKQSLDLRLLTNYTLWEVYRFCTKMSKSLRCFIMDVLDKNFNLVLQDSLHERNFVSYLMTKEKFLQNHPDGQKTEFLNSPFQVLEVYNRVDMTSDFQTGQEVETLQETSSDPNQVEDMDPYPFCKHIGLNLWSTDERPAGRKMDLTSLTNGAVIEIFGFVRELSSSPHRMVYDILEHNFDLDLQSGETTAVQAIQRWNSTQKSLRWKMTSQRILTWLNALVPLNAPAEPEPELPASDELEGPEPEDVKQEKEDLNGGFEKKVFSYRICEEIGLDLNIRSKQGPKTKLELQTLTRGVLFEMHQYVRQNCNRYVPALYEILEYNFDLSSQNHRKVEFAWSLASQVIAIAGKHGRKGDYLNKAIELPVEITESSQFVCKKEPKEEFIKVGLNDDNDIVFVQELKPVDIDVVID